MSYFDDNEDSITLGALFSGVGMRYYHRTPLRQEKTCNRCGVDELHWEQDDQGWYLADEEGEEHVCKEADQHAVAADDFEVLP